jgi:hypothetical protein
MSGTDRQPSQPSSRSSVSRVDLVGGQAGPVVLAHRLDHVVDEPLDVGGADPLRRKRVGRLAQNGMPEPRDLQNGHDVEKCNTRAGLGRARTGV